jgi:ribosomal protein S18 acetylase RimI-like enzyme
MSSTDIVISRGLSEHQRADAVAIFEEAFGDKMRMAVRDRDKRMAFMARTYDPDHVIVATRGGRLVGMAGLRTRDGRYRGGLLDIPWDPRPYRDLLGVSGAIWAILGLRLADHKPARDELYVDGIAVSPEARGAGIGTRLLDEITTIARELRLRWVRLDVIDTNARAQALYERLGFKVTKVQSFRYKERWVGFGAMISMERAVAAESPKTEPGPV